MLIRRNLQNSKKIILDSWNQEFKEIHPISDRIFKNKIIDCSLVISELSYALYLDDKYIGFIVVKKSSLEDNKNILYISLIHVIKEYRNQGYGNYLLNCVFLFLDKTNYNKIYVGGDELCIFSGVFNQNNTDTHSFFTERGFEIQSKNVNLIVHKKLDVFYENKDVKFILGVSEDLKASVLYLIQQNFSKRWFSEVLNTENYNLGVLLKDNDVIGFINTANIYSEYYPNSMNDYLLFEKLSGIGPLGIKPEYQGKGLGLYMVNKTLQHLFEKGASDIMVDWTGLEYFYKKCGFMKIHEGYVIYQYRMED